MFPLLVVLFLIVPIVELYVIVQVAGGIGVLETIGLLVVVSIVGAALVRHQGMSVLRKIQAELRRGSMPTRQLVDGGLILFAGALMLTPGFVTDAVGVLLLLPPSRVVVRSALMRRFRGRLVVGGIAGGPMGGAYGPMGGAYGPMGHAGGMVIDVDADSTEPVDLTRDDAPDEPPPSLP